MYGNVDYWDDRAKRAVKEESFEWYQNYGGIRHFLSPKYLNKPSEKNDDQKSSDDVDAAGKTPSLVAEATTSSFEPDDKRGDQKSPIDGTKTATKHPSKNPYPSNKDCRVLIAGCGNSQVGEAMLSDGFRKITNIDFSSIVINQGKEKYTDEWHEKLFTRLRRERKSGEDETMKSPGKKESRIRSKPRPSTRSLPKKKAVNPNFDRMVFECQDLTKKLNFPDESFDLIFCKGTFDAVLCSANTADKVQCMMDECHRVLDNKYGVMVIVSYGDPENRLNYFDNSRWEVKTYTVPKPFVPGEKIGE
eukprot:CAMPEP_0201947352 /NCGR_PEP_ID=MMETSP0903-20130614/54897_1 /ASSEMBLY_ACC=CAM_ASM_000552 /TAXON_ID=420261 /ORGANISM="Thalassiosira antarctica, Strain CCMP982" /LENGTH=303 /DNA_ID=CAMNT_0048490491 /DNA_START=109 /DNA_END=1020 /DNA_ORIENTATION=+